jgi:hypothetical protein
LNGRSRGRSGRSKRRSRPSQRVPAGGAAFGDHLIEPAVEARQRFGDAIGRRRSMLDWRRSSRERLRSMLVRHAFELTRQLVETIVDRREVVMDGLVVILSI